MGALAVGNSNYNGRIYSFVGVNRTLTSAETLGLESYLANKSGLADALSATIYTRSSETLLDRSGSTIERRTF